MVRKRQVIALGGGGFSSEPQNLALDRYILSQSGEEKPRVAFIGTATGNSAIYAANFYRAYNTLNCTPAHLSFFERTPDLREFLFAQDVIYVGGGNTKSMLAVWRDWGFDSILKEAWHNGIVLAGISAGAICWFEQGITDSWASELKVIDCMGFLKGSCCPHFDSEADRRPVYHKFLQQGQILPGYALDDGAAIHFVGDDVHRVVTSRPQARAYRVECVGGEIKESPLPLGEGFSGLT